MDLTKCPHCKKRMKAVATSDGRTGLRCLRCDKVEPLKKVDPLQADAAKWADDPLTSPTKAA